MHKKKWSFFPKQKSRQNSLQKWRMGQKKSRVKARLKHNPINTFKIIMLNYLKLNYNKNLKTEPYIVWESWY